MEESEDKKEIEIQLAQRLIKKLAENRGGSVLENLEKLIEESTGNSEKGSELAQVVGEGSTHDQALIPSPTEDGLEGEANPSATFVKVEKSLASLGYFTPSSNRMKNQESKKIVFTREIDGKRVEVSAEIHPSVKFGLPITADQDKYLALQQLITEIHQREGKVTNPIRFKSSDLLKLLGRSTVGGKNYRDIGEWLHVMKATTIESRGVVYEAGKENYASDMFSVFDRVVIVGSKMEDGSIADANLVWLSSWQLDNINQNYLIPLDLNTYRELKNHISKALVPLLQTWLYATQKSGSFEKRYKELCDLLKIQQHQVPSLIKRQLKPSLDELVKYEYLAKWQIEKTSDEKAYKIVFFHGAKYHRDRRKQIERKQNATDSTIIAESEPVVGALADAGGQVSKQFRRKRKVIVASDAFPPSHSSGTANPALPADVLTMLEELTSRGVLQSVALELLWKLSPEQRASIPDYVDYWDSIPPDPARGKGAGLLLHLIETGDPLPPTFETRRTRRQRIANEKRTEALRVLKETLEVEYDEYRNTTVEKFINDVLTPAEFDRRVVAWIANRDKQGDLWTPARPDLNYNLAIRSVRAEVAKEVPMLAFEDFRQRELPRLAKDLGLNLTDLGLEAWTLPNPPDRAPSNVLVKDDPDHPDPSKSLP